MHSFVAIILLQVVYVRDVNVLNEQKHTLL